MEPTAAGALNKTPLAQLLVYCLDKRLRGTLVFRPAGSADNAQADVVTLVDGLPAKIRIADPVEHLGRVLLEIGAIDDAAYNESLMALGKGGGLQGQILLKAGKIDAATLEKGLRQQIARKLGHLFARPPTTTYGYFDGTDLLARYGGPELYPVSPLGVIWTGIRAHPSMPHVDAALERLGPTPLRLRADAALQAFDLSRGEKELAERVRVTPMNATQLQEMGIVDGRTTRLLLYALVLTKQLEPAPTSETARVSVPAPRMSPPVSEGVRESISAPKPVATASMPAPAQAIAPAPSHAIAQSMQRPTGASSGNVSAARPVASVADVLKKASAVASAVNQQPSAARAPSPSASVPSQPVASGDRRAEIVAKSAALAKETHFQTLGIAPDASIDDAKSAYFQLAKRWHPDRLPPDLIDLKDDVAKIFAAMADAYQALTDPERRDRYVKLVKEGGGTQADAEEVARVVDANNSFQRALFFVDKQQFKEAEGHAKRAIELEPNDPEHISVWCWIEGNRPERRESQRFEDLIAKLDRVLADAPKNERARYYRAMMLKWGGRVGDAMRDFREIADANPRHTEAMREVRLHSMRNERDRKTKDDGSGSLLGRFVKKK